MDLPKYNPNVTCRKCGCTDIKTEYCEHKGGRLMEICWCKVDDEHMHRTCERCRYEWLEAVLNE